VHFIGVCGTAMASTAVELQRCGWNVSGSDSAFYPPMSDFLSGSGIRLYQGFNAQNLPDDGLIVVGNAISRGNVELEAALDRNLLCVSLPDLIQRQFLVGRKSVVIAGTHGKTTSTALMAHILRYAGREPGWLVGGIPNDLETPCRKGSGEVFVIEGDEYDSAWFDKRPKFLYYRPFYAGITSLEFDHSDIYADIQAISAEFKRFAGLLPQTGRLVVNGDDRNAVDAASAARCPVVTYGLSGQCQWRLGKFYIDKDKFWHAPCYIDNEASGELRLKIPGRHNLMNAMLCLALAEEMGVDRQVALEAIFSFTGVQRRLTGMRLMSNCRLYDDFAHHPTAVQAALETVRAMHPQARLWALFEPRSNTMVRRFFQNELTEALAIADKVIIGPVHRAASIPAEQRLDRNKIVNELKARGIEAEYYDNYEAMAAKIKSEIRRGDVIVMMSNGAFGGIREELLN